MRSLIEKQMIKKILTLILFLMFISCVPADVLCYGETIKEETTEKKSEPSKEKEKNENLIERRTLGDWIRSSLLDKDKPVSKPDVFEKEIVGHYRSNIPEVSKFVQLPQSGTVKCNFPVQLLTSTEEKLQKQRHSKETQIMLVGIAEGSLGYLDASGKVSNIESGDNINPDLSLDDNFYQSSKVVLYAKAKIKGKYLLTTRYDSTRDYHDQIYSWINPEKYYPIYGDKSTLTNDNDSQGKFFIRIDRNDSYSLIGNYTTEQFAQTQLSKYSRTLGGLTTHVKSEDFFDTDNIKGSISFFGSENIQDQRQDIFAGKGTSGPFYLTRVPMLIDTEIVRVEVRDKTRYDIVLSTEIKTRDTDYEIDYYTGRIMFRQPVPTYNENNDPVYVVVDYEYLATGDDKNRYVTGSRAEVTFFDKMRVGSQIITENKSESSRTITGIDSVIQLTDNIRLQGEWAHSENKTTDVESGDAMRVEGSGHFFDNKLKLQAYAAQIDSNFSNPVNVTESGIQKYGATGEFAINKNLTLLADHWAARAMKESIYDRRSKVDLFYKNDKLFASTGYAYDETTAEVGDVPDTRKHEINLKGGLFITKNAILSGEYSWQRGLYDKSFKTQIHRISPRLDVKVSDNTSLYARQDFTYEETYDTTDSLTNNVTNVGIMTAKDGRRSYVEYGFVGGKIDSTTFGEEQDFSVNDKMTMSTWANRVASKDKNEEVIGYNSRIEISKNFYVGGAFERTKTTGDTDFEQTATSLTADYIKDEDNRWGAKAEYMSNKTVREYTGGLNATFKTSPSTSFVAKAEYHKEYDWKHTSTLRETKRLITGIAYRPIQNDQLNFFAKYEYNDNLDNTSISISDYSQHIASLEGIYDISSHWQLFGKYALKSAHEGAGGINTSSFTDLKTAKLMYRLNEYFDFSGLYRILQNYNTETLKQSAALEAGLTLYNQIRIAAGYNFLDYDDTEYPGESYQGVGPYINCSLALSEAELYGIPGVKELTCDRLDAIKAQIVQQKVKDLSDSEILDLNKIFQEAERLYKDGKYIEAETFYKKIELKMTQIKYEADAKVQTKLEKEEKIASLFNEAEMLYQEKKYVEAKEMYNEILRGINL